MQCHNKFHCRRLNGNGYKDTKKNKTTQKLAFSAITFAEKLLFQPSFSLKKLRFLLELIPITQQPYWRR